MITIKKRPEAIFRTFLKFSFEVLQTSNFYNL